MASLSAAGLQDRDHLTALAVQGSIAATQEAFALWCCGGNRIVAWGAPDSGGDNSAIQDLLRNVQQVKALKTGFHAGAITNGAFAVILAGGSVITWGASTAGGDSSAYKISSGVCSFSPQHRHSLPSWKVDLW